MNTIKVFISQPMKDKSESEILIARDETITKIKQMFPDDEVVIINSYFMDYSPKEGNIPLKYLAKSIELLADADVVYFCPGWEHARGCIIEYECAFAYGISCIEASNDHTFDITVRSGIIDSKNETKFTNYTEHCDNDIIPTSLMRDFYNIFTIKE